MIGSAETTIRCHGYDNVWNEDTTSIYYGYPKDFITSGNINGENNLPDSLKGLQHTYMYKGIYNVTLKPAIDFEEIKTACKNIINNSSSVANNANDVNKILKHYTFMNTIHILGNG